MGAVREEERTNGQTDRQTAATYGLTEKARGRTTTRERKQTRRMMDRSRIEGIEKRKKGQQRRFGIWWTLRSHFFFPLALFQSYCVHTSRNGDGYLVPVKRSFPGPAGSGNMQMGDVDWGHMWVAVSKQLGKRRGSAPRAGCDWCIRLERKVLMEGDRGPMFRVEQTGWESVPASGMIWSAKADARHLHPALRAVAGVPSAGRQPPPGSPGTDCSRRYHWCGDT